MRRRRVPQRSSRTGGAAPAVRRAEDGSRAAPRRPLDLSSGAAEGDGVGGEEAQHDVFSYKNMAAVEALPVLVAGNGEGMGGVWRLVEATLEVIEEYVPKKDAENNYVGEEREFDF